MENVARQPDRPEPDSKDVTRSLSVLLARIRALETLVRPEEGDEGQLALDLPTLRQGLGELADITGALLAEIQTASGELLLADLPDLPLSEALSQLVEATAEAHALSSRSIFSGQERALPDHFSRLLYRSAQEALARVPTHEGARRLRFSLDYREAEIVLSIEDDGVPGNAELFFEHAPGDALPPFLEADATGNNAANALLQRLRGMLEGLGGSLTMASSLELGTQVQVRLPYHAEEPALERASQPPIADPSTKITILLVDSQAVSRAGLHRLLESYPDLEVVGEAADSMQAVSETAELLPQVVLIDASGEQSLETLRQLRQLNPALHVLLLADREREELLYEALRAGASGSILKDIAPDELASSVRLVARGEVLVQPHMAARLLARLGDNQRVPQENLTARERDVLQLLGRGLRNKEIAARLIVSERTVNFHLANIYAKLHVSGRTEALSKALERGLLKV